MKKSILLILLILTMGSFSQARSSSNKNAKLPEKEIILNNEEAKAESTLVNVDKNSKLSDYLKKINQKVTSDSEAISLEDDEDRSTAKVKIDEADIPLMIKTEKQEKSASLTPLNKMMIAIFALLLIGGLVLAWAQKIGNKKGHTEIAKNIKILTQKSLGAKKNLMLIRVAGETILIGVTDNNINHIKTLSLMEDELPEYTEPRFSNQLKSKIEETKISDEKEEVDGFSVSRLDDVKGAITKRFSV